MAKYLRTSSISAELENLIEYDENLKMYFPTEDMFHGLIDKYDKK
ncbi:MAG: hypothetical protein V3V28_08800 [Polaribacter sp.]